MAMIDEGRWSPEPSVVGEHSTHRHPEPESVDAQLAILSEQVIEQHTNGDCPACVDDSCQLLAWALGWQSGDRRPYPA